MRNLLLLSMATVLSFPAYVAEAATPEKIVESNVYAISPNGQYMVSWGMMGTKIYNLSNGQIADYTEGSDNEVHTPGLANCVSNNGIVVGGPDTDVAQYWKEGEWYDLKIPVNSTGRAFSQSITPDGHRICGSISVGEIDLDADALTLVPCVWTWDEKKQDYGMPVMLPHPKVDFSGRLPQYITAIDISEDGKTVAGQVRTATGMLHYPIIYRENDEGIWNYTTLFEDKIIPEGEVFPKYPGENPAVFPEFQDYMTASELQAYNDAIEEVYASGFTLPWPEFEDYMTAEELASYKKDLAQAEEISQAWQEKFYAWMEVMEKCLMTWSEFEFNAIRISPDGKQFANTMLVPGEPDYDLGYIPVTNNIWVFDINGDIVAKYDQDEEFSLTYLANDGIALATTSSSTLPQSFVLAGGKAYAMKEWISSKIPAYSSWIDENMTFEIARFDMNPETGDWEEVFFEETLTGRALGNSDLSLIALGIDNYWDYEDDGVTCIFDMKSGSAVSTVSPSDTETVIYDLSGRRLKNADAPGIYIFNGKKKVVR